MSTPDKEKLEGYENNNEEEEEEEQNNEDLIVMNHESCNGNSDSIDSELLGKVVNSEREAFDLYNEYALSMGFSVRRGKCRYHQGTNLISQREFYCWKEGFSHNSKIVGKDDHSGQERNKRKGGGSCNRLETRTGCKAFIRFSVKDGVWTVTHFHPEHNHELASPSERHLLKSGRLRREFAKTAMGTENDGDNVEGNGEGCSTVSWQEDYDDDLMGKVVHSEEEAFRLYNEYALRTGFSVRRGKYRYHQGTSKVSQREFLCWKEGLKVDDDPNQAKKSDKLETRTGCKASIRFSVSDDAWTVTHFHAEHNHKLASLSERFLLRSRREITDGKPGGNDTNTSKKQVSSDLSVEVAGVDNAGFNKDFCSYVNSKKIVQIDDGDVQSLLDHFIYRKVQDPMFSYAVQLDKENRITNCFWRDGRMRFDYDCFGDVMVFNTTYRSTKYNILCAYFLGVNHHWQNVIFGGAFLLDETVASFVWLLKSFLSSTGNRAPKTIITDEDQAILTAVAAVFPTSHQRLSLSQIAMKAPSFSELLNTNLDFRDLFDKLHVGCNSEAEFHSTWDQMVQEYNLGCQDWLKSLYKSRHKWSSAFAGDTFVAGIESSQRNESTISVLEGLVDASISLTNFAMAFDNIVSGMRSSELAEEFCCNQGAPSVAVSKSSILTHASKIYTHRIYNYFEKQFLNCLATTWVENSSSGAISTFQITEEGNTRVFSVQFDTSNNGLRCSCRMFESEGILCSHALRVLNVECLSEIPRQYILKRWTNEARKGAMSYEERAFSDVNSREKELVWRNSMTRIAFNILDKCQFKVGTRELCQKKILAIEDAIEREVARLKLSEIENGALNELEAGRKMRRTVDEMNAC